LQQSFQIMQSDRQKQDPRPHGLLKAVSCSQFWGRPQTFAVHNLGVDGMVVGVALGFSVGLSDGIALGMPVGVIVGLALGFAVGLSDGMALGMSDGMALGFTVGLREGM
jgi:hypothetical protein